MSQSCRLHPTQGRLAWVAMQALVMLAAAAIACGTGDAIPADLTSRATAARRARGEANRSASCATCPSVDAAA